MLNVQRGIDYSTLEGVYTVCEVDNAKGMFTQLVDAMLHQTGTKLGNGFVHCVYVVCQQPGAPHMLCETSLMHYD